MVLVFEEKLDVSIQGLFIVFFKSLFAVAVLSLSLVLRETQKLFNVCVCF